MTYRTGIVVAATCMFLGAGRATDAGSIHLPHRGDATEEDETAANVVHYDRVLALYHQEPTRFENAHPFYAKLFTDPSVMDKFVTKWESHERRFEYWNPSLWKILDGYVHNFAGQPVDTLYPPAGDHGSTDLDADVSASSVPEPSTGVLMIFSLMIGLFYLTSRKLSRCSDREKGDIPNFAC